MIEILLLRHAETEYNAHQKYIGGRSNHIPLSVLGQEQAIDNAMQFKTAKYCFDQVFCSSAIRAQQTLSAITDVMPLMECEITFHDELNEVCQGDWEGQPIKECLTPENLKLIVDQAPHWKAPNGESHHEAEVRMMTFIQHNILDKYSDGKFLIVGHGLAFKCLLQGILGLDPKRTFALGIGNVSKTKLRYDVGRGWFLDYMNRE